MLNLIKNPNLNSSFVFRADILSDSRQDEADSLLFKTISDDGESSDVAQVDSYVMDMQGFRRTRTILRKMIPRNPQLHHALLQTCIFFIADRVCREEHVQHLVVYVPHATTAEEIPYYHPGVRAVAFLHTTEFISIHYALFDHSISEIDPRLFRTAKQLLQTLHKHGHGIAAGYTKRVHHDLIVPQARYQDTYTRLKARHAKRLIDDWKEVTDPAKHVFEDLSIAAFLIELWRDMYRIDRLDNHGDQKERSERDKQATEMKDTVISSAFPGFVDVACGNGVLVEILNREGYDGWGFDARRRKSWSTFLVDRQGKLKQMVLIPAPLLSAPDEKDQKDGKNDDGQPDITTTTGLGAITGFLAQTQFHDGRFPPGTFIISNHGDEVTGWTPILAALAGYAPFLTIPCCSHNLSGARFRAPPPPPPLTTLLSSPSSYSSPPLSLSSKSAANNDKVVDERNHDGRRMQAPESGMIQPTSSSTYAGLVAWTANIASSLGYVVETEALRIPSTRNMALLGRHNHHRQCHSRSRPESQFGTLDARHLPTLVVTTGSEVDDTVVLPAVKLSEMEIVNEVIHRFTTATTASGRADVDKSNVDRSRQDENNNINGDSNSSSGRGRGRCHPHPTNTTIINTNINNTTTTTTPSIDRNRNSLFQAWVDHMIKLKP